MGEGIEADLLVLQTVTTGEKSTKRDTEVLAVTVTAVTTETGRVDIL